MKRQIKIRYVDFWSTFDRENFILTKALKETNDVVIVNDGSADYVIYSTFGNQHWDLPDSCIKIFYTGENICPDFNACDYAIGFERLEFGDRYLRLPNYYCTPHFLKSTEIMENGKFRNRSENDLLNRKFCCFVVSQSSGNPTRLRLFEELSKYKSVDSGGRWKNNVGGPVEDKLSFQSQYKFCIAGENASHAGYTTEKIIEAYASGCIPIYWGDPDIAKVFNPNSFINVSNYNSIKDLLDVIAEIDSDSSLYLKMLNEPIYLNPQLNSIETKFRETVHFMENIVNQPLKSAYRRSRDEWGITYIKQNQEMIKMTKKTLKEHIKDYISRRFNS